MISDVQIVAIAVTVGAIGTNLCGDSFWAVLFLSYFAVFADTATKWIAITKRYYVDTTGCTLLDVRWIQVVKGILNDAWSPNYLTSRGLGRIPEKIFMYTIVIAICHAAGKWLPVFEFAGIVLKPSMVFPASASISVFLVELSSINENLKEMGQTGIADMLSKVVAMVVNKFAPRI